MLSGGVCRQEGGQLVRYVITGVDTKGKRFRMYTSTLFYADCINLWRGSVWEEDDNGKRRLLKRVYN
jgi:hypothetical protein